MQKLQLKPYHPTLIVELNEDDFDRRSQSSEICFEKLLLGLTIFFGATSVNLTETEQLIVTIVSTGLLKIFMRHLVCQTEEEEQMMAWCGLSSNGLLGPYFFGETVTGSTYRQMLVDYA